MSSKKWPPDIILVEWVDSVVTSKWNSYESLCDGGLNDEHLKHISVGYLVKKTAKSVTLTHSVGIELLNCCDCIQIPMRAVKKISYLKNMGEQNVTSEK